MIKTTILTGTEQEVTFAGTHTTYWVQNLGSGDILVGLEPELADGKDDVLIVPSGGTGYVRRDTGTKTVYLSGTGKAQVYGTNNAFCPFKAAPKGGGEVTSKGGTITTVTVDYPIVSLNLYGNSVQDGTPTPEAPIDIVSVGDDGTIAITLNNGGDITLSAEIASGLPLCSVNNLCDELVYRADGTGKIIKRTAKMVFDGTNEKGIVMSFDETTGVIQWRSNFLTNMHINNGSVWGNGLCSHAEYNPVASMAFSHFAPILDNNYLFLRFWFQNIGVQTNNELNAWLQSNPVTVIYQLETPQEIELSAAEITALMKLQTFEGTTYIYNDEDAEMKVKIVTNPMFSELIKPVLDGINAKFEARISALEAAVTNT